jgi:uncharacterized protein
LAKVHTEEVMNLDSMRSLHGRRGAVAAAALAVGALLSVAALTATPASAQLQLPKGQPGLPAAPGAAASGGPATGGIPPPPFGGQGVPGGPDPMATLPDLPGVVPWPLLGSVKVKAVRDRFVPEFPASVARLHRQDVKVQGFMMPLEAGDSQKHFLLTVTPQTCAFCVPAGPEGIVEVRTRKPVKVTFEPVVVAGRFEVLKDDPMGVYYRINDGEAVRR